jgi:hypothetical protein
MPSDAGVLCRVELARPPLCIWPRSGHAGRGARGGAIAAAQDDHAGYDRAAMCRGLHAIVARNRHGKNRLETGRDRRLHRRQAQSRDAQSAIGWRRTAEVAVAPASFGGADAMHPLLFVRGLADVLGLDAYVAARS